MRELRASMHLRFLQLYPRELTLQMVVSDGVHNSSVLLEVRLIDVNDRDPRFNSSIRYSGSVAEVSCYRKAKPGHLLCTFQ